MNNLEIVKGNKSTIESIYRRFMEENRKLAKELLGQECKVFQLVEYINIYETIRDNERFEELSDVMKTKLVEFAYDMWCDIDESYTENIAYTICKLLDSQVDPSEILNMTKSEFLDEIML